MLAYTEMGLPAFCALTDNGDGTGNITCNPAMGDAGSFPITITVTDDGTPNLADSEAFTLTVGAVNQPPVLDPIGDQMVDEGATLVVPLNANDPDGDALAYTEVGLPGFCALTDNGNGTGDVTCNPAFGDAGTFPVTVTITDDGIPNLADSETFDIVVADVNRAPVLDPTGVPVALAVGALGVLVGLAIGALAASVKVLAKRGDPILTFYSLTAMVLAGVYFPIDHLPAALRPFSYLFVHTYVISGLRHALLPLKGGLAGPSAGESALALALMSLVLIPAALWAFGRAMEYGRRMGLLAGY